MKVRELIEKLKGMDQERPVYTYIGMDANWWPLQENEVAETDAKGCAGKGLPVVFIGEI
jgi:hypothetical protein